MTRRRLDPMGRAALQVAFEAQGPASTGPVVFASRWGEITRSVSLLRELTQGEPLSPTAFSLSVHNASSAVYSIARNDTANFAAISAGPCSSAAGVCEALGLLADGAQRVLVVSVEAPLPAPYEPFETHPLPIRAWAALIESGGNLRLEAAPAQAFPDEPLPSDLAVLRFLTGATPMLHQPGWRWTRHE
ncbi:Beta-ketoacyl synthase, N-terminal domain [Roseateles sp. YR242]|nr:Beta-ketoacyl synthase, N-terminal domain [Roseateles sp. YR242]